MEPSIDGRLHEPFFSRYEGFNGSLGDVDDKVNLL